MDLSKNIRDIRESLKIKQIEMANALDIDPPNYARLEKRGNKLSFEQLQQIADVFKMSVVEIIEYPNGSSVGNSEELEKLRKENDDLKERNSILITVKEMLERDNQQIRDSEIKYVSDYLAITEENKDYAKEFLAKVSIATNYQEICLDVISFLRSGIFEKNISINKEKGLISFCFLNLIDRCRLLPFLFENEGVALGVLYDNGISNFLEPSYFKEIYHLLLKNGLINLNNIEEKFKLTVSKEAFINTFAFLIDRFNVNFEI